MNKEKLRPILGVETAQGIFVWEDVTNKLVIQYATRDWCKLPYPGHPKGCPEVGASPNCPPQAPLVEEAFDLNFPHYFCIEEFDLAAHTAKMKAKYPKWSDKQCRCVLYWQNGVKKRLRNQCKQIVSAQPGYGYTLRPEAMGVNVFRTCHRQGIRMRKNPRDKVIKVGLVAKLRKQL